MPEDTTQDVAATVADDAGKTEAPSQGRTEKEKAAYSLKKTAERLAELGGDPAEVLGVKTHIETNPSDEDSKPVTVGMLRNIQKEDAQKSALQMAEDIEDDETRNTVKTYLSDNIVPSGNADKDFRLALAAASAEKNKQVIAEVNRYTPAKRIASGGSAPAKIEEEFVPTPEEAEFMKHPYLVPKEKILEARKKAQAKQQ